MMWKKRRLRLIASFMLIALCYLVNASDNDNVHQPNNVFLRQSSPSTNNSITNTTPSPTLLPTTPTPSPAPANSTMKTLLYSLACCVGLIIAICVGLYYGREWSFQEEGNRAAKTAKSFREKMMQHPYLVLKLNVSCCRSRRRRHYAPTLKNGNADNNNNNDGSREDPRNEYALFLPMRLKHAWKPIHLYLQVGLRVTSIISTIVVLTSNQDAPLVNRIIGASSLFLGELMIHTWYGYYHYGFKSSTITNNSDNRQPSQASRSTHELWSILYHNGKRQQLPPQHMYTDDYQWLDWVCLPFVFVFHVGTLVARLVTSRGGTRRRDTALGGDTAERDSSSNEKTSNESHGDRYAVLIGLLVGSFAYPLLFLLSTSSVGVVFGFLLHHVSCEYYDAKLFSKTKLEFVLALLFLDGWFRRVDDYGSDVDEFLDAWALYKVQQDSSSLITTINNSKIRGRPSIIFTRKKSLQQLEKDYEYHDDTDSMQPDSSSTYSISGPPSEAYEEIVAPLLWKDSPQQEEQLRQQPSNAGDDDDDDADVEIGLVQASSASTSTFGEIQFGPSASSTSVVVEGASPRRIERLMGAAVPTVVDELTQYFQVDTKEEEDDERRNPEESVEEERVSTSPRVSDDKLNEDQADAGLKNITNEEIIFQDESFESGDLKDNRKNNKSSRKLKDRSSSKRRMKRTSLKPGGELHVVQQTELVMNFRTFLENDAVERLQESFVQSPDSQPAGTLDDRVHLEAKPEQFVDDDSMVESPNVQIQNLESLESGEMSMKEVRDNHASPHRRRAPKEKSRRRSRHESSRKLKARRNKYDKTSRHDGESRRRHRSRKTSSRNTGKDRHRKSRRKKVKEYAPATSTHIGFDSTARDATHNQGEDSLHISDSIDTSEYSSRFLNDNSSSVQREASLHVSDLLPESSRDDEDETSSFAYDSSSQQPEDALPHASTLLDDTEYSSENEQMDDTIYSENQLLDDTEYSSRDQLDESEYSENQLLHDTEYSSREQLDDLEQSSREERSTLSLEQNQSSTSSFLSSHRQTKNSKLSPRLLEDTTFSPRSSGSSWAEDLLSTPSVSTPVSSYNREPGSRSPLQRYEPDITNDYADYDTSTTALETPTSVHREHKHQQSNRKSLAAGQPKSSWVPDLPMVSDNSSAQRDVTPIVSNASLQKSKKSKKKKSSSHHGKNARSSSGNNETKRTRNNTPQDRQRTRSRRSRRSERKKAQHGKSRSMSREEERRRRRRRRSRSEHRGRSRKKQPKKGVSVYRMSLKPRAVEDPNPQPQSSRAGDSLFSIGVDDDEVQIFQDLLADVYGKENGSLEEAKSETPGQDENRRLSSLTLDSLEEARRSRSQQDDDERTSIVRNSSSSKMILDAVTAARKSPAIGATSQHRHKSQRQKKKHRHRGSSWARDSLEFSSTGCSGSRSFDSSLQKKATNLRELDAESRRRRKTSRRMSHQQEKLTRRSTTSSSQGDGGGGNGPTA